MNKENYANGEPTWLEWINSAANDADRMNERVVVPVEMARELAARLDECYRDRAERHAGYTFECLCQSCGKQFALEHESAPHVCKSCTADKAKKYDAIIEDKINAIARQIKNES